MTVSWYAVTSKTFESISNSNSAHSIIIISAVIGHITQGIGPHHDSYVHETIFKDFVLVSLYLSRFF